MSATVNYSSEHGENLPLYAGWEGVENKITEGWRFTLAAAVLANNPIISEFIMNTHVGDITDIINDEIDILKLACKFNRKYIVDDIMSRFSSIKKTDLDLTMPAFKEAVKFNYELCKRFIIGKYPSQFQKYHIFALQYAAGNDRCDMMTYFLKHKFDIYINSELLMSTFSHVKSYEMAIIIYEHLREIGKVPRDSDNNEMLELAVRADNIYMVTVFGWQDVNAPLRKRSLTLLQLSVGNNYRYDRDLSKISWCNGPNVEIAQKLISLGADINKHKVGENLVYTLLRSLCVCPDEHANEYVEKSKPFIKEMCKRIKNINEPNKHEWTTSLYAIRLGDLEILEYLFDIARIDPTTVRERYEKYSNKKIDNDDIIKMINKYSKTWNRVQKLKADSAAKIKKARDASEATQRNHQKKSSPITYDESKNINELLQIIKDQNKIIMNLKSSTIILDRDI